MRDDPSGPIFIGGLSHSGKTEMRMFLDAHPDICMTRRTYLWDRFYGRFGDLSRPESLERCLSAISVVEGVRRLNVDLERIQREFLNGPASYARLFELVHRHHAEQMGKRRWGDQLGFVERFADPIFEAFPSARMIHMIRDPRARYAEGAARVRRRRGALGLETAKWLHSTALADRNRRRYPTKYRVVRFEMLAADPVTTVREVCAFLGEQYASPMDDLAATIGFDTTGDSKESPSDGGGVCPETAFVDRYARRDLVALDYPVANGKLSARNHLSFLLVDWPLNRAAMAAWHIIADRPSRQRSRQRVRRVET